MPWGFSALTEEWGQIFPKWPPPEKGTFMNIPESFFSNVLPPQTRQGVENREVGMVCIWGWARGPMPTSVALGTVFSQSPPTQQGWWSRGWVGELGIGEGAAKIIVINRTTRQNVRNHLSFSNTINNPVLK